MYFRLNAAVNILVIESLDLLIPPIEHLLAVHFVPRVHTYIIFLPEDHYQLRNPTYNTIRTSEAVEEAENNEGQQQEEEDGEYNYNQARRRIQTPVHAYHV